MKPNILLIMSDQHNRATAGCYGDPIVQTPNLDRLAVEGMRFDCMYTPAPLCVPARAAFMTSRYPNQIGVTDNLHSSRDDLPTWAHHMTLAGYETLLFGKMHFSGMDQFRGFEKRPVGESIRKTQGNEEKYQRGSAAQNPVAIRTSGYGNTIHQYREQRYTEEFRSYLEKKAKGDDNRPFIAVIGYLFPRCPFIPTRELYEKYHARVELPEVEKDQPETIKRFRRDRGILESDITDDIRRSALAGYYGLCEMLDTEIGKVLDALDRSGMADDTLVIYTSDHGEMAGQHGCWWKSCYYEGSAGVPAIARWPGKIQPGSVTRKVCNLIDLGPTFLELAGESMPECDGRSLVEILEKGDKAEWLDETFSEFSESKFTGESTYPSRMFRQGPWKLWLYGDQENLPAALFNLDEDPEELHDRHADPQCRGILDHMLERVREGWNPKEIQERDRSAREHHLLLKQWQRKVHHPSPIPEIIPPENLEKDLNIIGYSL